jgi:hypothetical protein
MPYKNNKKGSATRKEFKLRKESAKLKEVHIK